MSAAFDIPAEDTADFHIWQTVTNSQILDRRKQAKIAFATNQYCINFDVVIQNLDPNNPSNTIRKIDWMGYQNDDITHGYGKFIRIQYIDNKVISQNIVYAVQCTKDPKYSLYFSYDGAVYRTVTIKEHNGIQHYQVCTKIVEDAFRIEREARKKYLRSVGCNTLWQFFNNTHYVVDHKVRYGHDTKASVINGDIFSSGLYNKNVMNLPHIVFSNKNICDQKHVILAAFHPLEGIYKNKYIYVTLNEAIVVLDSEPGGPQLKYHQILPKNVSAASMDVDIDDISDQMNKLLRINA
jgi:hypothetical protein